MENPVKYLTQQICAYVADIHGLDLNSSVSHTNNNDIKNLVRVHNAKLNTLGDLSVSSSFNIWKKYLNPCGELELKDLEEFDDPKNVEHAMGRINFHSEHHWAFTVQRIQMKNERYTLWLDRNTVISQILRRVLNLDKDQLLYGHQKKDENMRVCVLPAPESKNGANELSIYRASLIEDALKRLIEYSNWNVVQEVNEGGSDVVPVKVVSVAEKAGQPDDYDSDDTVIVKCGIVTEPQTGKLVGISTKDYFNFRTLDMRLMAVHKYGVREKEDNNLSITLKRLGAAAVTVDLLEVKPSSPVHIIRNKQGSTKGAAFILYNSARLETLLRQFDERVQSRSYGQLPNMMNIDLTLLKEEEEWQLIYGYIFTFPDLIERCLEHLRQGICSTHLIVRFLSDFVALFSAYYRRIRILTDIREQLMPLVYARIYLIKSVREILNRTLALLDIEPVSFM